MRNNCLAYVHGPVPPHGEDLKARQKQLPCNKRHTVEARQTQQTTVDDRQCKVAVHPRRRGEAVKGVLQIPGCNTNLLATRIKR